MGESFPTKLIEDGRLTVPKNIREILGLDTGTPVRVTIERV